MALWARNLDLKLFSWRPPVAGCGNSRHLMLSERAWAKLKESKNTWKTLFSKKFLVVLASLCHADTSLIVNFSQFGFDCYFLLYICFIKHRNRLVGQQASWTIIFQRQYSWQQVMSLVLWFRDAVLISECRWHWPAVLIRTNVLLAFEPHP